MSDIGRRVDFRYTHPITYDRILGSGVIVGDSVIIGTDYGYTVKRDSDGELIEVRCTSCSFPQPAPLVSKNTSDVIADAQRRVPRYNFGPQS